jgi:hypothetical protein
MEGSEVEIGKRAEITRNIPTKLDAEDSGNIGELL